MTGHGGGSTVTGGYLWDVNSTQAIFDEPERSTSTSAKITCSLSWGRKNKRSITDSTDQRRV